MPLCSRCLGACLGHVLSVGLLFLGSLPEWRVAIVLAGVMFADWAAQEWVGITSTNPRRLVTGTLGGLGVGSVYWMCLGTIWTSGVELLGRFSPLR